MTNFSNDLIELSLELCFVLDVFYSFAQGLRLRHVDMMCDDIAASSATLTKMSRKLRKVSCLLLPKIAVYSENLQHLSVCRLGQGFSNVFDLGHLCK